MLLALCAAALAPLTVFHFGLDSYYYAIYQDCFARQFWQGDWAPRWCFAADQGLGAPVFIFYPPFAYYVGSLLYPAAALFGAPFALVLLNLGLATVTAAFAARHWLCAVAGPKAALFGAALYLLLPFRSEVVALRGNIAEAWVIAFAPLVFHAAREMVMRKPRATPRFALWTALSLFAHPASAVCVVMGAAVYGTAMAWRDGRVLARFAAAGLAAAAVTLCYSLPGMYYAAFVSLRERHTLAPAWQDDFLRLSDLAAGQARPVALLGLCALALAAACALTVFRRRRLPDAFMRRETLCWAVIGALSLLLLFPLSKPWWDAVAFAAPIDFPWRAQILLLLPLAFFGAVCARWLTPEIRPGDALAGVLFLWLLEWFLVPDRGADDPRYAAALRLMLSEKALYIPEYRTVWTSPAEYGKYWKQSLPEAAQADTLPRVGVIGGDARVHPLHWEWDGMVMRVQAQKPSVLRLRHRYFPLWQARGEGGQAVRLSPEPETGLMRLSIPAGDYTVTVTQQPCWIHCRAREKK